MRLTSRNIKNNAHDFHNKYRYNRQRRAFQKANERSENQIRSPF